MHLPGEQHGEHGGREENDCGVLDGHEEDRAQGEHGGEGGGGAVKCGIEQSKLQASIVGR